MIIKVNKSRDQSTWWILDDIKDITVHPIENVEKKPKQFEQCFIEKEAKTFRQVECVLGDSSICRILFSNIAFLCNDNGKTIDKIVGYVKG